jgi:hypothetical protein
MKGIVRHRLIALLSAAGLAGTASSSAAQVVKGEPSDKTQTSSTIKNGKSNQENKAATAEALGKGEQKKWSETNSTKNDAAIKYRKAGGEQKAAQDVVSEKVGPDHIVHKHIAGVKYEKSQTASHADASSKDASKMAKTAKENTAVAGQNQIKMNKGSKESTGTAASIKGGKVSAESGASKQYEWIKATGKKQGGAQGHTAPKPTQETPK